MNNPVGERICDQVIKNLVSSNEGMIDPAVATADSFDESVANGLLIGVDISHVQVNGKTYCRAESLCDASIARKEGVPF
jgi:hypothetical protein